MTQNNIYKIGQSIMPSVYNRDCGTICRILRTYPLKVQNEVISDLWERLLSLDNGTHFNWFVDKIELPFNAAYMRHINLN